MITFFPVGILFFKALPFPGGICPMRYPEKMKALLQNL